MSKWSGWRWLGVGTATHEMFWGCRAGKRMRKDLPTTGDMTEELLGGPRDRTVETTYKGRGRPRKSDARDEQKTLVKPKKTIKIKGLELDDIVKHPLVATKDHTLHPNMLANLEFEDVKNPKQRKLLAAFGKHGTILAGLEEADCTYAAHHYWMHNDEEYPALFERAKAIFCDRLDEEVFRRAVRGVEQPVFYCGKEVGKIRKYSDILLIFAAKGAMPQKYNTERREVSGRGGGSIQVDHKHEHTLQLTYENKEKLLTDISAEINRRRAIDLETIDTIAKEVEQIDEQKALSEPEDLTPEENTA